MYCGFAISTFCPPDLTARPNFVYSLAPVYGTVNVGVSDAGADATGTAAGETAYSYGCISNKYSTPSSLAGNSGSEAV